MKWDEDRFGLEYDLDLYNIVAVNDFNMGAMENKVTTRGRRFGPGRGRVASCPFLRPFHHSPFRVDRNQRKQKKERARRERERSVLVVDVNVPRQAAHSTRESCGAAEGFSCESSSAARETQS